MKTTKILSLVLALLLLLTGTALAENTFPLTTEPVTLKVMAYVGAVYPSDGFGAVSCMKEYEKMTGVTIEWDNVPTGVFSNTLASYIAGDTLPDIILKGSISNADANNWGSEGILVNLAPYLEENAPNFFALMNEYPTIKQAVTNANGEIFGLPQVVLAPAMRAPGKLYVNNKALAAVGKEAPKTLDELYDVLKAIKTSDWNGNGEADEIPFISSASTMRKYFYGSFGLRTRGAHYDVVDVDPETHELRIFAQHENFRKALEYLHKLYAEGLIYQEIFTDGFNNAPAQAASEQLSVFANTTPFAVPSKFIADWEGVLWQPAGPDGYAISSEIRSQLHSVNNFCITDACKNVELALKWVDYFYSAEGSRFVLIGVENQDWETKADGTSYFTDAALATWTENMTEDNFKAQFGLWAGGRVPAAFTDNLFGAEYEPMPSKTASAMLEYASDVIWPFFNWTEDENKVISTVQSDINKYINNSFAEIVSGEVELTDEWWNGFVKQIDDIGADKLLAVYEAAVQRAFPNGDY